jgi:hypothetical protein
MRREVLSNRIIQYYPALVTQFQQQCRGEHLGRRTNLEQGVDRNGFLSFDAPHTVTLGIHQFPVTHHSYGSPRYVVVHEKTLHCPIDQFCETGFRLLPCGKTRGPHDDEA